MPNLDSKRQTNDVSFHLINPKTNNRIRMVPTDPDTGPVERANLVKGYEVAKDQYVLFDEADFDKVKLEETAERAEPRAIPIMMAGSIAAARAATWPSRVASCTSPER